MDIDWSKFHEFTKKFDPISHYAVDGIWKSSTKLVNKTANAIDNGGWVEQSSGKDNKDFDRWFENSVGSVAAIFGGMYGAGALGAGSGAAGGTGLGATSGATGSGLALGASGGGTGAGLSTAGTMAGGSATSLGTTGLGISGQTGAGLGGTGGMSWLNNLSMPRQQQQQQPSGSMAAMAMRTPEGYREAPGWIDPEREREERDKQLLRELRQR